MSGPATRNNHDEPGKPVQIVRPSVETGLLELDHDALKSVLCHESVGNKPIALISIIGGYRTGKSFLLNFILQYFQKKGYENPSWLEGASETELVGFDWKGGDDPTTIGISMWSKPFLVEKNGKQVAVFVIDTQGHFGLDDNKQQSKIAVITSMLLSSLTIFNIKERVQKPDLEFIELCIEYSEKTKKGETTCPLQGLHFLIRDRQPSKKFPYGDKGGKKYLKEVILNPRGGSIGRMTTAMQQAFKPIGCFLMPHPGTECQREEFRGKLAEVNNKNEFIQTLDDFCKRVVNPKQLVVKENLLCHKLMTIIIANFDAMKENAGRLPDEKSYERMRRENDVSEAFYTTAANFGSEMDRILECGYLQPDQLNRQYEEVLRESKLAFRKEVDFLGEAAIKEEEKRLEVHLEQRHKKRCLIANDIAKLVDADTVEFAVRLILLYKAGLEKEMSEMSAEEWESKLDEKQKKLRMEAETAFEEQSTKSDFDYGLKFLTAGMDCVKGFMELRLRFITKIKRGGELQEFKDKVYREVKEFSEKTLTVFHGKKFKEIEDVKTSRFVGDARKLELAHVIAGFGFTEEIKQMVETAFELMKAREESLRPFGNHILDVDLKFRRLKYLETVGEELDGAYIIPNVLDELHEKNLQHLLPLNDDEDPVLCDYRIKVKKALDAELREFKKWNEQNKSIFKRTISKVAAAIGVAGTAASGGAAAGLFFAEIAIVTTVGAAVATGIGAAIIGGVLVAGGAVFAFFKMRKKAGNARIWERIKKIKEGHVTQEDDDCYDDRRNAKEETPR